MPFDYYSMPFCKPSEGIKKAAGTINPGTILMGMRIENSPYNFSMMASPATALALSLFCSSTGSAPNRMRDPSQIYLPSYCMTDAFRAGGE